MEKPPQKVCGGFEKIRFPGVLSPEQRGKLQFIDEINLVVGADAHIGPYG